MNALVSFVVQEDEYGFTGSAEEQAAAAKIQNKWRTRAPEQGMICRCAQQCSHSSINFQPAKCKHKQ